MFLDVCKQKAFNLLLEVCKMQVGLISQIFAGLEAQVF